MTADGATLPRPPVAERRPTSRVVHGVTLVDDYAWLRAENWQEVMRDPAVLDAEIRAHLEAENTYQQAVMAGGEALRERLFEEMKGRIKQDDSSVPAPDGPYAYASRYRVGGQHPILVRTPREGGEETVLLDGDAEAEGLAYFRLGGSAHSPDHRLIAWSADTKGSEFYTLRLREAETGTNLPDTIERTGGGAVWDAAGASFLYVWLDDNHRPAKVFRHVVGTDPATDTLVYEEPDPGFFLGVGKTQSGRFLVIDSHDHETSEVRLLDAADPGGTPRLVAPRETAIEYDVDHVDGPDGGLLVIRTNADGAEDYKLVTAPPATPGRADWRDLVPHVAGRIVLSHTAYAGHVVRLEREGGLPRITVRRLADGAEHAIAFPEEAYSLGLSTSLEHATTVIRFTYSSMTTPAQVYDYDMETRTRVLRKTQEVPSGHDPTAYVTRRLQARAADGELVPVSLIHRADTQVDGSAPCLLYGYGSYGITIPAAFSTNALSLVDRGFVYAIAHIRGGKDKGQRWYKDGRREKKANTFTDFLAAADHLVETGYAHPCKLVAQGGSAGGMLMGAVVNMRPDRFAGIIAEVPFVDVMATMLDASLPLTPPEWPEWGNPIEDEAAFRTILSYSPYDNVGPRPYPPILAVGGLTDPRVTYWEPAKWVAKLRTAQTGTAPILLKTNMEAGHGGASGRFDRLKEVALVQSFALMVTGVAGA